MPRSWRYTWLTIVCAALPAAAQDVQLPPEPPESTAVEPADGREIPEATARPALGLRFLRGPAVVVEEVLQDSPADIAGLQPGDRIIQLNGEMLDSTDAFVLRVAGVSIDEPLELMFLRGAERHVVAIQPEAWEAVFPTQYSVSRPELDNGDRVEVITPRAAHFTVPYVVTNVSPVVVPAAWYVPYPYYYTAAWYWPGWYYYSYYAPAAYYAPFYYAPYYTYYYPWGAVPVRAVVPAAPDATDGFDTTHLQSPDWRTTGPVSPAAAH